MKYLLIVFLLIVLCNGYRSSILSNYETIKVCHLPWIVKYLDNDNYLREKTVTLDEYNRLNKDKNIISASGSTNDGCLAINK